MPLKYPIIATLERQQEAGEAKSYESRQWRWTPPTGKYSLCLMFNLPLDKKAAKLHAITLNNGVRECGRTVKYQSYKLNAICNV